MEMETDAKAFTRICELDIGDPPDDLNLKERQALAVEHVAHSKHQEKLENWILQNFSCHYNRLHARQFEWAKRGQPPQPDYEVLPELGAQPLFVEVTELLDPGRKRGDEYKSDLKQAKERTGGIIPPNFIPPSPANYEQQLTAQAFSRLEQKFSKPYPSGTWLIIYFNPTSFTPSWDDTLSFAINVVAKAASMLDKPDKIRQVWVLTNDGRIGPIPSLVTP